MEQFHECPLVLESYPSLPDDNGFVSSPKNENTKAARAPRKMLKARRLIRKQIEENSEATKELRKHNKIHSIRNVLKSSPSGSCAPIIPLRAIQKSVGKNNLNVRLSDYSFLENERLCAVECEGDEDLKVQQLKKNELTYKPNIKDCTNVLQKRKLSEKINTLSKKRRTLEGEENNRPNAIKFADSRLNKPNICKLPVTPKPMPNFSRIFQIQSEYSENILEYTERKAERAAKLLSGAKPPRPTPTPQLQIPRFDKELTFTTEDSPNIAKLPILTKEYGIYTPYPRNRKMYEERDGNEINSSNSNVIAKKFEFPDNNITKRLRGASKTKLITSSTPYNASNIRSDFFYNKDEHIDNKKQDTANSKEDYKTRGLEYKSTSKETLNIKTTFKLSGQRTNNVIVPVKTITTEIAPNTKTVIENKTFGNKIRKIPVLLKKQTVPTTIESKKEIQNVANATGGLVDFKFANEKLHRVKKDDLAKAIQTKTRVQEREITAAARHNIKGVRLNRRFELLMQMRYNDNSLL